MRGITRAALLFPLGVMALRMQAIKGLQGPEPDAPVPEGTTDQCTYYFTTSEGDDCAYVESYWGITHDQFVRWNPSVEDDCSGIAPEYSYCVEVNSGGDITSAVPTTSAEPTSTGSPAPSPTLDGTAPNCDAWHFVVVGDDCDSITSTYGITMDQLMEWNENVESDCSGLWAQYYFCVSVEGHEPPTVTDGPEPTATGNVPSPTLDGTAPDCDAYHFVEVGDDCESITKEYGITMEQLMEWNTAVQSDCSGLWAQYYYCVSVEGHEPSITEPGPSPTGEPTPSPTLDGTHEDCDDYHLVETGDNCEAICADYGITMTQFMAWNTAVKSDCSGLWAEYYYCVSIEGHNPPAPAPTTTQPGAPAPTQTGIVKDCQDCGCQEDHPTPTQPGAICECDKWHKIASGDSCWSLAQRYDVTEQQIKNWNPGTNCNMWLGYYVCVGA
ncbi:LysM domain-containing protein [Emericellopsis atlantica]|uniref:LysM domain-containing protein n=1 Tax=Emericellopsis atlantica TaxID=2614577 RepID=A0A9P7ZGC4_9HYPO|nr:LysM domain-containing protein [Emericellopsis atlantica]KAG9251629.1 LysM domain-containing protein [Emericellopsis atlantica]